MSRLHIQLAPIVAWLIFFASATCVAAEAPEGPPTCESLKKPIRYAAPVARILLLDSAMYAGLVILWPDSFSPRAGSVEQFGQAWSKRPYMNSNRYFLQLDDDPWVINGVLHPIYGSEVYMSARTMGHSGLVAFLYAMGASLTWEYLVEGWFHRPSAIDLAWTPFAGAVLGELRFQLVRLLLRSGMHKVPRTILVTTLDPLGQLERLMLGCRLACARY